MLLECVSVESECVRFYFRLRYSPRARARTYTGNVTGNMRGERKSAETEARRREWKKPTTNATTNVWAWMRKNEKLRISSLVSSPCFLSWLNDLSALASRISSPVFSSIRMKNVRILLRKEWFCGMFSHFAAHCIAWENEWKRNWILSFCNLNTSTAAIVYAQAIYTLSKFNAKYKSDIAQGDWMKRAFNCEWPAARCGEKVSSSRCSAGCLTHRLLSQLTLFASRVLHYPYIYTAFTNSNP